MTIRLRRKSNSFWWVLQARNGQVFASSEMYSKPSNAVKAGRKAAAALAIPLYGFDRKRITI